mmetsp:Transcript_64966/g.116833  ORF Transcript_64966/g.116833 Transcript_64966/m.116833 type:complete len:93 (-) Transcript_64966:26-304(-)
MAGGKEWSLLKGTDTKPAITRPRMYRPCQSRGLRWLTDLRNGPRIPLMPMIFPSMTIANAAALPTIIPPTRDSTGVKGMLKCLQVQRDAGSM